MLLLALPISINASHAWSDVDICKMYEDKLPPGLSAELLPDSSSRGARLLARYCTQCHNLPGPDRHTAEEWQEVLPKMSMLMDVSNRFGGLMGRVEALPPSDQALLQSYLNRHAVDSKINKEPSGTESAIEPWLPRTMALLPVLLLIGLGLLRWWLTTRPGPR
ncbi:MAG: hypothetical protein P1R74_15975 [Sedimenticola sp.]|nr:hypothetical protein [Sedimenticola sp.]